MLKWRMKLRVSIRVFKSSLATEKHAQWRFAINAAGSAPWSCIVDNLGLTDFSLAVEEQTSKLSSTVKKAPSKQKKRFEVKKVSRSNPFYMITVSRIIAHMCDLCLAYRFTNNDYDLVECSVILGLG
jgi:hypothetical protein